MENLTGGQSIVRALIAEGVDTVFGLPGVQNDWLYNAFFDYKDKIKIIHTRHEQGAAYMALGYNLASGKIGVFNIVPGPGFLNSSAALVTAYGLNAQVLCLTGQIPTKAIGKNLGALHEIPGQLDILKKLTKWSERITSPAKAPELVSEAFRQLKNGRPRPVGLECAMDVLAASEEVSYSNYEPSKQEPCQIEESDISVSADLLLKAKRPLIFVGSGAMNASNEVELLAEKIQAPVFAYRTGKGIVSSEHYLSFPLPAAHEIWKDCDVAISIGSHMRLPLRKWGVDDQLKVININIDPEEHERFTKPAVKLTGDAAEILTAMLKKLPAENSPSIEEEMKVLRTNWENKVAYLEPQLSYLKVIREVLPPDGILVDELTQVGFASRIAYDVIKPRTYLSTGYMGTLGWGFPVAMGAKVAKPQVPVVSVTGDGGFMFNVQELSTAVQHKIGVIVILFNNGLFGNVRNMQEELYDNKVIATDLHNPDFVELAKLFGAHAYSADGPEDLRDKLKLAVKNEGPTLIEVKVGNDLPSTDRFKALPKVRG